MRRWEVGAGSVMVGVVVVGGVSGRGGGLVVVVVGREWIWWDTDGWRDVVWS